ncbi:MAG: hypothetical protein PUH24_06200 [Prevotellaceae bacterium]|nr:hypothetical protein [Prevotella sp.]MDD7257843.1 hypothetical protein [Prevotellaceae bacterium]MDY6130075.1 hypothetical protein [Prevotella sp.]
MKKYIKPSIKEKIGNIDVILMAASGISTETSEEPATGSALGKESSIWLSEDE